MCVDAAAALFARARRRPPVRVEVADTKRVSAAFARYAKLRRAL
jgi:hypothetical protein